MFEMLKESLSWCFLCKEYPIKNIFLSRISKTYQCSPNIYIIYGYDHDVLSAKWRKVKKKWLYRDYILYYFLINEFEKRV